MDSDFLKDINPRIKIPLKLKLFLPVTLIIIIVVAVSAIIFINLSISGYNDHIRKTLELEVKTITRMFERESILKTDKVKTNLKVAHRVFHEKNLDYRGDSVNIKIENQESGEFNNVWLKTVDRAQIPLFNDTALIAEMFDLFGGTVTIFQYSEYGFVRIATNVEKSDGSSAQLTYIPLSSPVSKALLEGKTYFGRAFVVDSWFTTAYEPFYINDKIAGAIYVGYEEKDVSELTKILETLTIGKTGFPFVMDNEGNMLIYPKNQKHFDNNKLVFEQINGKKEGLVHINSGGQEHSIAFRYFEPFQIYIAATIVKDEENKDIISKSIISSLIVGLSAILLLSVLIYRFTTEKLYRYFSELKIINKKLASAEIALKRSERLASMGQISAGIAHELNNPLGVITMYSNIVLDELKHDDPIAEDMKIIVTQAERCKNIVGGLLNFARKNKVKLNETNIVDFMHQSLKNVVIPKEIEVVFNTDISDPMINIDAEQMMQAVTNLEKNAVEAMPGQGKLEIKIDGNEKQVEISISDTGCGIPQENMEKLFTPFFTTKDFGKGTGLGLPLVYGIIKMHTGKISVESNTDINDGPTGTSFKITLPRIT